MRGARRLAGFVLLTILALVTLALAACTSGSAAPNLSPVSSGPAGSASGTSASPTFSASAPVGYPADVPLTGHNVKPGEKPPVYPAAANARTQAGANAFAEFFLHTWDWAYATTNPSYMKHYFGPTCGLCRGVATGITKTAQAHHWFEGGRFIIHPASTTQVAPVTAPADFCSVATIDASAQTIVDAQGNLVTGEPPHSQVHYKLCARRVGAVWQVTFWART